MKFLLLLSLVSCSFMWGSRTTKSAKDSHYTLSFRSTDWMLKNDERSDYIWENAVDGRILLSNSFCEEFQDQSLEALAKKTFETVDQFKSLKKAYVTFHHREAYRFEGSGIVDGMKVSLRLLNTRRNGCYFDFVAITPTSDPQKDDSTFEEFLNAVVFK